MLEFLKPKIEASQAASVLVEAVNRDESNEILLRSFGEEKVAGVDHRLLLDEMMYLRLFTVDYAIHQIVGETTVVDALRTWFQVHVKLFIQRRGCRPMPIGKWMGDENYLWVVEEQRDEGHADPYANLHERFDLYTEALQRRDAAHMATGPMLGSAFAGLCSSPSITLTFLGAAVFDSTWEPARKFLHSHRILANVG